MSGNAYDHLFIKGVRIEAPGVRKSTKANYHFAKLFFHNAPRTTPTIKELRAKNYINPKGKFSKVVCLKPKR